MKLAIIHKEKCKPTICGREREATEVAGGSLRWGAHFVERFTKVEGSSLDSGAWLILEVIL